MKLTIDTDWFLCLKGEDNSITGEVFSAILWGENNVSPAARVGLNVVKRFMDHAAEVSAKRSQARKAGYESAPAEKQTENAPVQETEQTPSVDQQKKDIEYLYALYPTKCPTQGRSLGKCSKDKVRLRTLLKVKSVEQVAATINNYVTECTNNRGYMKNFSTFLNNFPEDEECPRVVVRDSVREREENTIWQ